VKVWKKKRPRRETGTIYSERGAWFDVKDTKGKKKRKNPQEKVREEMTREDFDHTETGEGKQGTINDPKSSCKRKNVGGGEVLQRSQLATEEKKKRGEGEKKCNRPFEDNQQDR